MKKLIICVGIALVCSSVNAQMGLLGKKPVKQLEMLRERPLLVVLWDDGELDGYNENIKKAIAEVWTFSSDIRYITKDQWREMAKDKDEAQRYAHLYYTKKMLGGNAPNNSLVIGLLEKAVSTNFYYTPDTGLADLMLALHNIQTDLIMGADYKKIVKNQSMEFSRFLSDSLEHKTLYIDEALVTKKFLKKINDTYTYDYKLVSKDEIDNAILNKDPKVLFIREFVRAQRPITKSRLQLGDKRTDTDKVEIQKTASMNIGINLVYKASDLKQVGVAGMTGMGKMNADKEEGKIDIKGIEMFLKLIQ